VLDAASLSWKYYAPCRLDLDGAGCDRAHVPAYSADGKYDDTVCNGPDWTNAEPKVVIEGRMHNHQRYQWRSTCFRELGHPHWLGLGSPGNSKDTGIMGIAIVNAVSERVLGGHAIIVCGRLGGWYDHVARRFATLMKRATRALIVISPYAKRRTSRT